jgi:hypothetical protein
MPLASTRRAEEKSGICGEAQGQNILLSPVTGFIDCIEPNFCFQNVRDRKEHCFDEGALPQ